MARLALMLLLLAAPVFAQTNPQLPDAYVYHCMWQYRPWDADWALCVPHERCRTWREGRYRVDLVTRHESGDMLVGSHDHGGRSPLAAKSPRHAG